MKRLQQKRRNPHLSYRVIPLLSDLAVVLKKAITYCCLFWSQYCAKTMQSHTKETFLFEGWQRDTDHNEWDRMAIKVMRMKHFSQYWHCYSKGCKWMHRNMFLAQEAKFSLWGWMEARSRRACFTLILQKSCITERAWHQIRCQAASALDVERNYAISSIAAWWVRLLSFCKLGR